MRALGYEVVETRALRDVPDPDAPAGEHLIRVEAVGICGSDMHAYLGHDARRPAPLILGHEAAGTIVGGPRDGDRVTVNPLVTCQTCPACRAGRATLCPTRQIISLPPRPGAFAQSITMPARDHVAGVTDVTVVEPNPARRAFLEQTCGQRAVARAEGAFPVVIDAVGYAKTRAVASTLATPGGVIAHVGLGEDTGGLDIRRLTLQEITFIGTYTYTADDFRQTAQALFDGRLGPLDWIEHRGLSEGAAAFADLLGGRVASPKIVLDPSA